MRRQPVGKIAQKPGIGREVLNQLLHDAAVGNPTQQDGGKLAGFTLVELAIVLVIVGLLIGGLLVGQSLIASARINAQIQQIRQFDVAATQFRQKFKQIPGDCSICPYPAGYGPGNNNGLINDYNGTTPPAGLWQEPTFFFVNLYDMGIIATRYKITANTFMFGPNKQFPNAKIGRGGLAVTGTVFGDIYYTFLFKGSSVGLNAFATLMAEGNFSPSEALALDAKMDDSLPADGKIRATDSVPAGSSSTLPLNIQPDNASSCVYISKYNISLSETNLCRLVIKSDLK